MAPAGEDDSRVRSGRLFTHSPVKFGRPMRPIHCGEVSSENSFKANFRECPECELRQNGVLRCSRTSLNRCQMDDTFAIYLFPLGYLVAGRLWWG
jgi:hypothetical protein